MSIGTPTEHCSKPIEKLLTRLVFWLSHAALNAKTLSQAFAEGTDFGSFCKLAPMKS